MRKSEHLLRAAAIAAALVVGGPASIVAATDAVAVVDGDTIQIGGEIFPLYGIDAPELGQLCIDDNKWKRCGIAAAFELRKLLKFDEPLNCEPAPGDSRRYICIAAQVDLSLVLLKGGYVVAAPKSDPAHREAESQARYGNLGLWHMTFVPPWDWRAGKHMPGELEAEAAKCPIKAILDANGRRIYYVPTDANFKNIDVDVSAGGRFFCSVAETEAAGWRRPGAR